MRAVKRSSLSARSAAHPVWGGCGWKVYLETREDITRTIAYIENNPLKADLPPQAWPFVKKYDGWLPGPACIVRKSDQTRDRRVAVRNRENREIPSFPRNLGQMERIVVVFRNQEEQIGRVDPLGD